MIDITSFFYCVGFFFLGGILGSLLTWRLIKRYLTKNPPINAQQIKEIFKQTGRTPSEKKVKQIIENIKKFK